MIRISPATVFTFNLGPITTLFIKKSLNCWISKWNFYISQWNFYISQWNFYISPWFILDLTMKFLDFSLKFFFAFGKSPGFEISLSLSFGNHVALHCPLADYITLLRSQPDPAHNCEFRIELEHRAWILTCEPRDLLGQYFHSQWLIPLLSSGPLYPRQPLRRNHLRCHCCHFLQKNLIKFSSKEFDQIFFERIWSNFLNHKSWCSTSKLAWRSPSR